MKKLYTPILLLLTLLAGLCASCMDETLVSTTYGIASGDGDRDMRLKVAVPRSLGLSDDPEANGKETRIETLDVLVFTKGKTDEAFYLLQAIAGKPTEGATNTFDVVMPIGEDFDVHFFANVHADLIAGNIFNNRGKLRETLLAEITQGLVKTEPVEGGNGSYELATNLQLNTVPLPMYGRVSNVSISKENPAEGKMNVSVLRSVATTCVATRATIDLDNHIITPGKLDNFEMRELYVYYPAAKGLIAPLPANLDPKDKEGNVNSPTLPPSVGEGDNKGGTWWRDDNEVPNSLFRPQKLSAVPVGLLDGLYFYENIAGENAGTNQTRLVIGGVFDNEKMPDGSTPKVTYYRVNFWDDTETFFPVLRNHRYIFNIQKVDDSGYDTPDLAAKGLPINIKVKVIDWVDDMHDIDYDGQHYFKTSTKEIRLPRNLNSEILLPVECDVPADEWSWYFKEKTNGATTPQTWYQKKTDPGKGNDSIAPTKSLIFENSRFKVERIPILDSANKPTERVTLKFTALKAYSDKPSQLPEEDESYRNILVIEVKNLRIRFNIEQFDKSPDDWGNGGNQGNDVGQKTEEGTVDDVETEDWDDDGTDVGGESNFD